MKQSDIAAMLQRKRDINASANKSLTSLTMERSRLQQARTLAIRRQDYAEVAQIDAKLAELQANAPAKSREESSTDVLAKLNERNRRLNQEQVRKAERAEMERRRREKLARAGSGTATPTTAPSGAALDAAARLKAKMLGAGSSRSVVFTFLSCYLGVFVHEWLVDELSGFFCFRRLSSDRCVSLVRLSLAYVIHRPGTPGTPAVGSSTPRSVSPAATGEAPKSNGNMSFEASLLQSVEIDLGDF